MAYERELVLDLLKSARERIQQRWIQGAMTDPFGGVCSIGAINAAAEAMSRKTDDVHQAIKIMEHRKGAKAALRHQIGPRGIVGFNDSNHTTKADVLNKFDKAISCLEAEDV